MNVLTLDREEIGIGRTEPELRRHVVRDEVFDVPAGRATRPRATRRMTSVNSRSSSVEARRGDSGIAVVYPWLSANTPKFRRVMATWPKAYLFPEIASAVGRHTPADGHPSTRERHERRAFEPGRSLVARDRGLTAHRRRGCVRHRRPHRRPAPRNGVRAQSRAGPCNPRSTRPPTRRRASDSRRSRPRRAPRAATRQRAQGLCRRPCARSHRTKRKARGNSSRTTPRRAVNNE